MAPESEIAPVADELYAAALDDFIGLRKERAAAARKAGQRELATAIGALRKPTRSAWLVNLLAHEAGDDLTGLLDLGQALAEAQRSAQGPELRRLSTQRNQAVNALVRTASALGVERGHTASEATRTEVGQTLNAALSDPGLAEVVRAGHVTQAVSYGGFGPDLLLTPGSGGAATQLTPPTDLTAHRKKKESDADRLASLTAAAEAAMNRLEAARTEQEDAETADAETAETLEAAEAAVEAARRELAARESDLETAAAARTEAADRLQAAESETEQAEEVAARAAADLKKHPS